jgi:transposase InsO family protein
VWAIDRQQTVDPIRKADRARRPGRRITGDRSRPTRGKGWEYLHVCVDDASRLAYTELLPDERKESAVAFLVRALAWFTSLGVTALRVMTDNGGPTGAMPSASPACLDAGLKHKRTRPYTSRTNGKAERFIQTSLRDGPIARPSRVRPSGPRRCSLGSTTTTARGHTQR